MRGIFLCLPKGESERKPTTKKTLLISLLIGNALGVAIFFILLSIASAVMLKKGVSSGAYTPVSIVCAAIAAFIAGLFSVIPIRKNGLLLGLCSSVLLIACVVVSAAAAGGGVGIKTAIAVSCCSCMRLCRRYTCRKYEKENTMTVPQGTVLSCKI